MRVKTTLLIAITFLCISGCVTVGPVNVETDEKIDLELPPYNGPRKIIYVFNLNNQSDFDDPRIGRGISKMLTTALVNSGRFKVVERTPEMIASILDEQKLSVSGVVDQRTAVRVGQLLGAEAVIVGEVSEFGIRKTGTYTGFTGARTITTRIVIDARMVNVATAEIIAATSGIGTSSTRSSGVGAVLSFEYGTEGFDETSIGIATRKAVNAVTYKFARWITGQ